MKARCACAFSPALPEVELGERMTGFFELWPRHAEQADQDRLAVAETPKIADECASVRQPGPAGPARTGLNALPCLERRGKVSAGVFTDSKAIRRLGAG